MAILEITRRFQEDTGELTRSGNRWNQVYYVRVDSRSVGPYAVATAEIPGVARIPSRGELHDEDFSSLVTSVTPRRLDGSDTHWRVDVRFETTQGEGTAPFDPNPLARGRAVQWDNVDYEVPMAEDSAGLAVLNSAGQPFDPAILVPRSYDVLTITRNEATYAPGTNRLYRNKTNTSPFFGAPAGEALMKPIRARQMWENNIQFWQVTYQIWFSADGWTSQPLDVGFAELIAGKLVTMADENGLPYNTPQLLNGAGRKTTTPVYLAFTPYGAADFGPLGLESD